MANVLIIIKKFKVWEIHFQKNDNINQSITLDVHIQCMYLKNKLFSESGTFYALHIFSQFKI